MKYRGTLVLVAIFLFCAIGTARAQYGREGTLWAWTKDANHHESIVRISINHAIGTGVVVFKDLDRPTPNGHMGLCATALHVVEKLQATDLVDIRFRSGATTMQCKIVGTDVENDIALLEIDIPRSVPAGSVATDSIVRGDRIEATGLGGGGDLRSGLRTFSGTASPSTGDAQIYADLLLLPGDSGGPIFNSRQQIVGVVSGGWFWLDAGIRDVGGNFVKVTWPLRASNTIRLRKLIAAARGIADDDSLDDAAISRLASRVAETAPVAENSPSRP